MEVFWQKGYSGSSLRDLTEHMGINKPSMYGTFGNKESLFIQATEYYIERRMKPHIDLLKDSSIPLVKRLKYHLMSIVNMQCSGETPKGCYLILCQAEMASGDLPSDAQSLLVATEPLPRKVLEEFFSQDQEAIALGLHEHASDHALTLYTMLKGTSTMARSGVSVSELEVVVDANLRGIGLI